jgi:transketolase
VALDAAAYDNLRQIAHKVRTEIITMLHHVQTGHPGGSLSAVEILTVLYFNQMRVSSTDPESPDRDRFIASKGHCAPVVYQVLCEKGYFPREELLRLRQLGGILQGHPDMKKTPGIDMSAGSLGLGLSAGIGMALAGKLDHRDYFTYVLLGDGELQEGQVWEAAMAAPAFKLDRLIAIVDYNGVQLDGRVDDIMPLGDLADKFRAFGWHVMTVDGHDIRSLDATFDQARKRLQGPTVILANTVKGKGVSFMEGKNEWHGKPISDELYTQAMAELGGKS